MAGTDVSCDVSRACSLGLAGLGFSCLAVKSWSVSRVACKALCAALDELLPFIPRTDGRYPGEHFLFGDNNAYNQFVIQQEVKRKIIEDKVGGILIRVAMCWVATALCTGVAMWCFYKVCLLVHGRIRGDNSTPQ